MPDALKKLNLLIRSQNLKEGEKGLKVRNATFTLVVLRKKYFIEVYGIDV